MEVDNCQFPEDRLYDLENMVWVKINQPKLVTVGISSVLSALAGKLVSVKFKPTGLKFDRGRSIATIESPRYVGAVRLPISGVLAEVNGKLVKKPKLANDSPYQDGWFARIEPSDLDTEGARLKRIPEIGEHIAQQIKELKVRCFKAFPDYEMYEIGVECAAVLVRLNELIERMELGEVVHIVSDDSTADIEMVRWQDQTKQEVVEIRREGNIGHFVVRKVREPTS